MKLDDLSPDERLFIVALRLAYLHGDKGDKPGHYNGTFDNIRIERGSKSPKINVTFNWGANQQYYQRVSFSPEMLDKIKV
jgi:hypothetical protein